MNEWSLAQTTAPVVLANRLWRLLCSIRLALVLILLIAGASAVGTLIIQAPGEVLRNPLSYDRWVEEVSHRLGPFTGLLDFFGMFQVFRVWWFNTLVALLMLNLAVCTINRFPAMWRTLRRPMVKVSQHFFEQGNHRASFLSLAPSQRETSDVAFKALRQQRYQVTVESDDEGTHIYAEGNRYARFGTFFTHCGIIVGIAAALWGSVVGFSNNGLVIPNGSVRAVGHGTDLSVLNEGFIEEYYLDGRPKDYRSNLVIYENGREVKRQIIRVNEPVEYKGIHFHQSFFGNVAVMRVRHIANNELLFEDGVALAYRDEQYGETRPVGFITLLDGQLNINVIGTAQETVDNFIQPGEMGIVAYQGDNNTILFGEKLVQGEPLAIAGLEFTFLRENQFTGLSVVKNPGVKFIWLASSLMVLGMCAVLYFPHRRVWVFCSQDSQQSIVSMVGNAPRLSGFDITFQRLVSTLEHELSSSTNSQELGQHSHENGKEKRL